MSDDKPAKDDDAIWIDGEPYTDDDLTYREQHAMRAAIRELVGDPDSDPGDAALIDFVPAFVYVIKKRTDPDLTVHDVLDLKPSDLAAPTNAKGASRRPTKAQRSSG